jgi:hypothetical protein
MIKKTNKNSNRKRLTKGGRVKAAVGGRPRMVEDDKLKGKRKNNVSISREGNVREPQQTTQPKQAPKPTQAPQAPQTSQAFPKAPKEEKEQELNIGKTEEQLRRDAERYQESIDAQAAKEAAEAAAKEAARLAAEEAAAIAAAKAAEEAAKADIMRKTETPVNVNEVTGVETPYTPAQIETAKETARQERIRETGLQIEAAATGQVPEGAVIPDAEKVGGIDPETGEPIVRDQTISTMKGPTKVGFQKNAKGELVLDAEGNPIQIQAGQVAPETVSTGTAGTAQTPEEIKAAQMSASQVTADAQVDAAEGTVSDQAIAKAAEVDRVAPIEGADVDIPEGALAERVVGKISDGAKATAVMNVGSSLSRITRAKKQLSRAGLSDEDIKTIGNDPEDLEDRLADFSEEQRGIIEGLPEEALVSTQIDGLLQGMEDGEIPVWARPAVAQVEQMLAKRGMSASTVGRDSLFNSIIQAAMPIAQSNAQAIQSSVAQQRNIEAQESEANAARGQQTALDNAGKVFQMDMAQFNADQQTSLSNSKFMQTVALTEANNDQQATLQSAVLMSQANLAEADFYQKAQITNAQAFLQMDLTNLNNNQQANVLKSQQNQQRLLSNQSAVNAAAQFNAASENQTQQFMTNIKAQTDQYNVAQSNAMEQFNASQENAAEARRAGREADVEKFNAQLFSQADQFNSQQDFARNSWNAQNSAAVEASNIQWRRQSNTINTAAQNQINMQNAQNAYGMSMQSQSFLWQELRDQADFDFRAGENEQNRQAQIISTAMANEGESGKVYDDYVKGLLNTLTQSFKSGLSGSYTPTTGRGGNIKF